MEALTLFMLIFLGIAVALAAIVVWSPKKFWVKVIAIILAIVLLVFGYLAFADLLGRPKPIAMEWEYRDTEQAFILGAKIEEDKAIYLLLQLPQIAEPRYYVLPWDKELALELQKAMREAQREGSGGILFDFPFKKSLEKRKSPVIHPLPQLAPPDKPLPRPPQRFERPRGQGARF